MKSSLPPATQAERRRIDIIKQIGCIADAHHLISKATGKRISHHHTIALCPEKHHKYGPQSIHQGKRAFNDLYGSDAYLLAETNRRVADFEASIIGGQK